MIEHLPKPKTARGCVVSAALVTALWLAMFVGALYVVVANWR